MTSPDARSENQPPVRPVDLAQASTSGQFHAGLPPTSQRGSGMTPRCRHMSTVGRLTPSRSATSAMPTGSQSSMPDTVGKVLTDGKVCRDNRYMTTDTLRAALAAALAQVADEWADRLAAVRHLPWASPKRFAVENAYDCARSEAADAVRFAWAAAERDALDPDACGKCDGTGRISAFSHIHEGLCFACGGSGRIA